MTRGSFVAYLKGPGNRAGTVKHKVPGTPDRPARKSACGQAQLMTNRNAWASDDTRRLDNLRWCKNCERL